MARTTVERPPNFKEIPTKYSTSPSPNPPENLPPNPPENLPPIQQSIQQPIQQSIQQPIQQSIQPTRKTKKLSTKVEQLSKRITNYKTEEDLKKDRKLLNSELVCGSSGFCSTFNKSGSNALKELFNGYTDFTLVTSYNLISKTSDGKNKGANGQVTQFNYEISGVKAVSVMKQTLSSQLYTDNLFYEYIVGKSFINRIKKCFPCFCETYALFKNFSGFTKTNIPKDKPIDDINHTILTDSCKTPGNFSILLEYVNEHKSLRTLISELNRDKTGEFEKIWYCIFQIYFALAVLRKNFTHYDLHSGNVIIYQPKPGHYIKYNYVFNDRTISFKSQYCIKIIDYGRCFFDNTNLFNYETNSSIDVDPAKYTDRKDIPATSNKFINTEKPLFVSSNSLYEVLKGIEPDCYPRRDTFGRTINNYGFYFNDIRSCRDILSTFSIDFSKKNESHDLRLLYRVYEDLHETYSGNHAINYDSKDVDGREELLEPGGLIFIGKSTTSSTFNINNVYDACQCYARLINNEKKINDRMYNDDSKAIGELTVYSDGREMEFVSYSVNSSVNTTGNTGGLSRRIKNKRKRTSRNKKSLHR